MVLIIRVHMSHIFNSIYNGSEPFVFLSYAIEDVNSMAPIAKLLNENNVRVWLDQNPKKENLPIYATMRIPDCGFLLAYVSPSFLASKACIDSLKIASDSQKAIVAICPRDIVLPDDLPKNIVCFLPKHYHQILSHKGISACLKNADSTKTKKHDENPDLIFQQAERQYFNKHDPQRYVKAFYYYLKGADLKHVECMYNLGLCFRDGKGVYKDEKKAFEWFLKAAEHGHIRSMFVGCAV